MARIHDLIRQLEIESPDLARDLAREVDVLSERRAFGLNFERHTPEEVELPGRPVRRGDKVHILPPRGEAPKATNAVMWVVDSMDRTAGTAKAVRTVASGEVETRDVALVDLVVVAEFRDPIYPGLVSTGTVERGGDKPFHSVINGENVHALQTLLFTHRGKVDVIYIDPPYNTGARDWKYNNDYVESDDQYRHSKWLAFMERRLLLAQELLNPDDSVLIVTIDEKEYLRLGLLLEQVFQSARIQMVSALINPANVARRGGFGRNDEYVFFVMLGAAAPQRVPLGPEWVSRRGRTFVGSVRWDLLRRSGTNAQRADRPKLFYPIYVDPETRVVVGAGSAPAPTASPSSEGEPDGAVSVWPIRKDESEGNWQLGQKALLKHVEEGRVRLGGSLDKGFVVYYIKGGEYKKVLSGEYPVLGRNADGSLNLAGSDGDEFVTVPGTQWRVSSHDSTQYGSRLLATILPDRRFPFPKSLYAVEDAMRFFVADKPNALVIDFFAGSGTTAHAVMRLNRQDGGRRYSIMVTNNEVSAEEAAMLRAKGHLPGDPAWETLGICEHITKPRIKAAITGRTPHDQPIRGDYKFLDEFPIADGFDENVEFLALTYEAPLRVASHRDFPKVAPILWLRAGSTGRRIDSLEGGWDVADTYGVLTDLDKSDEFVSAVAAAPTVRVVFIVTDEDRLFEAIVRDLPEHVESVRMYDAYLRNFELESRVLR